MEDLDIARGILERMLDTSIDHFEFASQEYTTTSDDIV